MNGRPNDERGFIHKRIIGAVKGFAGGGFVGAASGFLRGGGRKGRRAPQRQFQPRVALQTVQRRPQFVETTSRRGGLLGSLLGRRETRREIFAEKRVTQRVSGGISTTTQAAAAQAAGMGLVCTSGAGAPRGTHLNKSGYFVQTSPGNPEAGGTWISAGSQCVTNRSRNPGNGRAVVRATSRIASFDRLARRVKKQLKAAAR